MTPTAEQMAFIHRSSCTVWTTRFHNTKHFKILKKLAEIYKVREI